MEKRRMVKNRYKTPTVKKSKNRNPPKELRNRCLIYNETYFSLLKFFLLNPKPTYSLEEIKTLVNINTWSSKVKYLLEDLKILSRSKSGRIHSFTISGDQAIHYLYSEFVYYIAYEFVKVYKKYRIPIKKLQQSEDQICKKESYIKKRLDNNDFSVLNQTITSKYNSQIITTDISIRKELGLNQAVNEVSGKSIPCADLKYVMEGQFNKNSVSKFELEYTLSFVKAFYIDKYNNFKGILSGTNNRKIMNWDIKETYTLLKQFIDENYCIGYNEFREILLKLLGGVNHKTFTDVFKGIVRYWGMNLEAEIYENSKLGVTFMKPFMDRKFEDIGRGDIQSFLYQLSYVVYINEQNNADLQ
jgi:hypothetical protein